MVHNPRIIRICNVAVTTNTRKCIEISLHTQELLHVSANHVAIVREVRWPQCWATHVGRRFNTACKVRSVEIITSRGCWRLTGQTLRSQDDLTGKHTCIHSCMYVYSSRNM